MRPWYLLKSWRWSAWGDGRFIIHCRTTVCLFGQMDDELRLTFGVGFNLAAGAVGGGRLRQLPFVFLITIL